MVCGAASGIGRAAATLLAARGAQLHLVDADGEGLASLAVELTAHTGVARQHVVDVTDEQAVRALRDAVGPLQALVNTVGITGRTGTPAHTIESEDFDRVVATNLRAAFLLTRAVVEPMVDAGYGRILHVASIAGKEGNPGMASYSATKAALIGLVKSVAKDYATSGVTVNALAPAVISTPLVDAMPTHQVSLNISKIPMRRLGTLAECAEAIAWIVSPAASFTTGFTFDLSGGRATY
jgi:3-oxoacyl-[acyl-carrier protein] reductase